MEACDTANQKEIQNTTISRKSEVDTFLECTRINSVTLQREGNDSKQSPI
jgi:hypothetical protein